MYSPSQCVWVVNTGAYKSMIKPLCVYRSAVAWLVVLLIGFAFAVLSGRAVAADDVDQIKAAYLYNFSRLTYWPSSDVANRGLTLCLLADSTLHQVLVTQASRHQGANDVAHVVSLGASDDLSACNMVFVDAQHNQQWFASASRANAGLLLVGEAEEFIRQGGVIRLFREGDRLRFEISVDNARRQQLQINSRLLKLAKVIGVNP